MPFASRILCRYALIAVFAVLALTSAACEDLEVADYNSEFRPVPTIERAPTARSAATVETAPTVEKFEGFEQAPTAEKFEGFEQAPTVTQAEGFKQAPNITEFKGFADYDEDNPCAIYLDKPTPEHAKQAAEWASDILEGSGGQIDPTDPLKTTAACQAALGRIQ